MDINWTALSNITGWGVVSYLMLVVLPKMFASMLETFKSEQMETRQTFKLEQQESRGLFRSEQSEERMQRDRHQHELMDEIKALHGGIAEVKGVVVRAEKVVVTPLREGHT